MSNRRGHGVKFLRSKCQICAVKMLNSVRHIRNSIGMKTGYGNVFTKSSIPRMIKNEKYIGTYTVGDIGIEDVIPSIISKEVFHMAQEENVRRRTSKQASRPRADYLLSGKLFCGHCKGKMTGVSGTSKTGDKHYYYYCHNSRYKKGCDKIQVVKDWIEEVVVTETIEHILQPKAVNYISNKCYEIQLKDNSNNEEVEFYKRRIVENKKALNNTLKAIESGVETESLPTRLRELEYEQSQLNKELKSAETRRIVLTPEHIEFLLRQYAEKGDDEYAYRKEVIESFVSEVFLYNDKLLMYYNIDESQEALAKSDLVLAELDEFDQQRANSTTTTTRKRPV